MCCVSYKRKRDKWIVLSSNMISWKHITVTLTFCNHCIFSHAYVYTSSFSCRSAIDTEQRIKLKYLVNIEKTPSQSLEMLQQAYGDNTMSCTHAYEMIHSDLQGGERLLKERKAFKKQD